MRMDTAQLWRELSIGLNSYSVDYLIISPSPVFSGVCWAQAERSSG